MTYSVMERYGLVWVRLVDNGLTHFPDFNKWDDPDYIRVLPNSVDINAAAGRQVEGFLDVSHFAFVHTESFGESNNPKVPDYPVERLPHGFRADYVSTVSNYPSSLKHLNPPGFFWRRLFEVWLPFTAKLTVFFLTVNCTFSMLPARFLLGRLGCSSRSAAILIRTRLYKIPSTSITRYFRKIKRSLRNSILRICRFGFRMKFILQRIKVP